MGLLEGAPKRDPEFILPPEEPEIIDAEKAIEGYRRSGRTFKIAFGAAAFVLAGSGVLVATGVGNQHPGSKIAAEPTESAASATYSPSPTKSESTSPSPTPSPTLASPTPSLSPSRAPKAASPSHIPSPTMTESKKVVTKSPTPSPVTSKPAPTGACSPNENAPGEVVCSEPVWAYSAPDGGQQAFQIVGGAAVNCSKIESGYVEVSISNADGWAKLDELGNPC